MESQWNYIARTSRTNNWKNKEKDYIWNAMNNHKQISVKLKSALNYQNVFSHVSLTGMKLILVEVLWDFWNY